MNRRDTNKNLYYQFSENFPEDKTTCFLKNADGLVLDYATLENESARYANLISSLGVEVGDRVSVQVEKTVEALWLYLGCLRGGFVFHPLNPAYQQNEINYFIENARPSLIVCDPAAEHHMRELATQFDIKNVLTLDRDGVGSLSEGAKNTEASFQTVMSDEEELAALLYSSGTTGQPKGIMLSHGNLASNTNALVETWGFTSDDCLLHALPMFHVHGLFVALGCVLMSGASLYWLPGFNVSMVLNTLPESTVMMGVPTYYTRLLGSEDFKKHHCDGVRLFVSGSAPLREETFHAFEALAGQPILERYGMTETGMNTSNPLIGKRKAGTVGLPLKGVEVRLVNDEGEDLSRLSKADQDIGHIQVKGNNVFKGYWNMPDKTKEDFTADGFFNTGDQGQIDEDGYLAIIGREKDMLISGGLNVYPREIELFIDEIDGVMESAVFGVAHADFGEVVVAAVVVDVGGAKGLSEQEVIEEAKSNIANYKVPKAIVFLEELPRNTMGKVQKKQLRETYKDLFKA